MSIRGLLSARFPEVARRVPFLWDLRAIIDIYRVGQREQRTCPCCGQTTYFRLVGTPPRLDALCPDCQSRERHRLLHLYLTRHTELFERRTLLHFAPERTLRTFLEPQTARYVPCDYMPKVDEIFANIEALDYSEDTFDLIICCHVLEHVDDAKALFELKRVLRPGCTALLMFPIIEGWDVTYEDSSITSERDKYLVFGQKDHVRYFGRDVRERIQQAGFELEEFTATEPDVRTYGLLRGEKIFICRKPGV